MKKIAHKSIFICLFFALITSCKTNPPEPTPIPTITPTPLPTPLPEIPTPQPAAEGKGNVYGRVLKDGEPLPALAMEIDGFVYIEDLQQYEFINEVVETDINGDFLFKDLPPYDSYRLSIFIEDDTFPFEGYQCNQQEVSVQANQDTFAGEFYVYKTDLEQLSPVSGTIEDSMPLLEWHAYPDAAYYQGSIKQTSGNYTDMEFESIEPIYQLQVPLMECGYQWEITAFNGSNRPLSGSSSAFYIENDSLPWCNLVFLYPPEGYYLTQSQVGILWESHPLAAYYNVVILPSTEYTEGDFKLCWPDYTDQSTLRVDVNEDGSFSQPKIPDLSSSIGCSVKFTVYANAADDLTLATGSIYINLVR